MGRKKNSTMKIFSVFILIFAFCNADYIPGFSYRSSPYSAFAAYKRQDSVPGFAEYKRQEGVPGYATYKRQGAVPGFANSRVYEKRGDEETENYLKRALRDAVYSYVKRNAETDALMAKVMDMQKRMSVWPLEGYWDDSGAKRAGVSQFFMPNEDDSGMASYKRGFTYAK